MVFRVENTELPGTSPALNEHGTFSTMVRGERPLSGSRTQSHAPTFCLGLQIPEAEGAEKNSLGPWKRMGVGSKASVQGSLWPYKTQKTQLEPKQEQTISA